MIDQTHHAVPFASHQQHTVEKNKKPTTLLSFLEAKKIDKARLKQFFIEHCSNIPQELRSVFWKVCLDLSGSFQAQFATSDKTFSDQYEYLKHVLQDVMLMSTQDAEELNFCIFLLDKESLPLAEADLNTEHPFFFIYKQMTEILDDQNDYETYYLTVELHDLLKSNLKSMKEKFNGALTSETPNKVIIEQMNIDTLLLSGLAGLFNDVKMYHILWDRLIMGECDLLAFTLLSYLESCREEHLKLLRSCRYSEVRAAQKRIAIDESKVLKRAAKHYKSLEHHSINPAVFNLIQNYFNTK